MIDNLDQVNLGLQNEYIAACTVFNTNPLRSFRERYYAEITAI